MIKKVVISKWAGKNIERLPTHVSDNLFVWIRSVEAKGLEEVRKSPGYHDEPCKGALQGLRSIRLNRGFRAYYRIELGVVQFVFIERVDKHAY